MNIVKPLAAIFTVAALTGFHELQRHDAKVLKKARTAWQQQDTTDMVKKGYRDIKIKSAVGLDLTEICDQNGSEKKDLVYTARLYGADSTIYTNYTLCVAHFDDVATRIATKTSVSPQQKVLEGQQITKQKADSIQKAAAADSIADAKQVADSVEKAKQDSTKLAQQEKKLNVPLDSLQAIDQKMMSNAGFNIIGRISTGQCDSQGYITKPIQSFDNAPVDVMYTMHNKDNNRLTYVACMAHIHEKDDKGIYSIGNGIVGDIRVVETALNIGSGSETKSKTNAKAPQPK